MPAAWGLELSWLSLAVQQTGQRCIYDVNGTLTTPVPEACSTGSGAVQNNTVCLRPQPGLQPANGSSLIWPTVVGKGTSTCIDGLQAGNLSRLLSWSIPS